MDFFKRHGKKIFFVLTIIALLMLIGFTLQRHGGMSKVENAVGRFLAPGNKLFSNMGIAIGKTFGKISCYFSLDDENAELKAELAKLREENLRLERIVAASDILTKEARLLERTEHKLKEASIIGKESESRYYSFTIDKGSKDGIKINQTVISAIKTDSYVIKEGLVGRVIDAGDTWAKVEAILDLNNSVSFKLTRTLDGGVLTGREDGKLSGYMFDETTDPKKGDNCVTSGLGGIYPSGIFIGKIEEVEMSTDALSKLIIVNPSVDFIKLDRCFVILD